MKKVSSRREPVKPAGRGKTKKVYRVSNWAAYNQALLQNENESNLFYQIALNSVFSYLPQFRECPIERILRRSLIFHQFGQ